MNNNKLHTIKEIVKADFCSGCGTCFGLCPFSAIEMKKDCNKGVYLPQLDEQKCRECGICYNVCPGTFIDFKELNEIIFCKQPEDLYFGNYLECYTGYSTTRDIRYNSASGGLVTTILINALEDGIIDGALVTKMKKNCPMEPEPFIARTKDEIIEASKSKYCPVPANIALREILKQAGKYAVVGLPCHIHGIRKAEMINETLKERIVLHISIFCSGTPNFLATEFIIRCLDLHIRDVTKIDYRGRGWPGSMALYLNDDVELLPYPGYMAGLGNLFLSYRCITCMDWFSKLSDLSFGDAWLLEIKKIDKIGTSTVISRTRRGDDILHQVLKKGEIELTPVGADKIYESQPGFARKKKQLITRLNILNLFGKKMTLSTDCSLPSPSFRDYLSNYFLFFQRFLASKRNLWWLLDTFRLFLRYK